MRKNFNSYFDVLVARSAMALEGLFFKIFWLSVLSEISNFADAFNYSNINLPENHLKYYFNSFPVIAEECRNDPTCPYKVS